MAKENFTAIALRKWNYIKINSLRVLIFSHLQCIIFIYYRCFLVKFDKVLLVFEIFTWIKELFFVFCFAIETATQRSVEKCNWVLIFLLCSFAYDSVFDLLWKTYLESPIPYYYDYNVCCNSWPKPQTPQSELGILVWQDYYCYFSQFF